MIYHVRRDAVLRARFTSDLEGLAREFKLSRAEYEALRDKDPRRLMDLGVHQYYVPQILRLFFGAAHNSNASAALECYRRAYPRGAPPGDGPARAAGALPVMASVVAAMAMTHSPGLTGWFTRASREYQERALQATAEMRRRLEAARPDVLVMFTNDHLLNWPINNMPEYTVGIGEEHVGPAEWFDEWLAMEKYRVGGHAPLARWIVNEGAHRGLAVSYLREMQFDDGISVPTHYLNPDARFRLVPVTMNCTVPPIPTPERAYQVGSRLRDILAAYPGDERT